MSKKETIAVDKKTIVRLYANICQFHAIYMEGYNDEESRMMYKYFKDILKDIKKLYKLQQNCSIIKEKGEQNEKEK